MTTPLEAMVSGLDASGSVIEFLAASWCYMTEKPATSFFSCAEWTD